MSELESQRNPNVKGQNIGSRNPEPKKYRERKSTFDPALEVVMTDDGSRTLFSREYHQCFHSESGAATEASAVFVTNGGVAERLAENLSTRVLEIGFGTGLNFILSAELANRFRTKMEFVAVDQKMIPTEIMEALEFERLPTIVESEQTENVMNWLTAWSRINAEQISNPVSLMFGKHAALNLSICAFEEFKTDNLPFDAIYLDAFSPDANAELWNPRVIRWLLEQLAPAGRLATYCVKSEIQQRFRDAGFNVKKVRGPVGGKREVLIAEKG